MMFYQKFFSWKRYAVQKFEIKLKHAQQVLVAQ